MSQVLCVFSATKLTVASQDLSALQELGKLLGVFFVHLGYTYVSYELVVWFPGFSLE